MATNAKRRKDRLTPTQARAARRVRQHRRKRLVRVGAFLAIGTVAGLFIISLFVPSLLTSVGVRGGGTGSVGVRVTNLGATHIQRGETHPPYNSVPATSGWHYDDESSPTRWGVHQEVVPDEVLVHNLEHAGVGVHYNCPDGCEELVEKLAEIVKSSNKVLLSPYPNMGTTIALTAWNYIDQFDEFDEDRIIDFILGNVNSSNAPEPFAR